MNEYLAAIGIGIVFIAQYIYVLGKLSAKMQDCEKNVEWIRDFLLSKCTDTTHFSQESAIQISEKLRDSIPLSWQDTLDDANINVDKCKSAYDCVVALSQNQGHIRLKKRASRLGIKHNDFLLASGIYLFERKDKTKK